MKVDLIFAAMKLPVRIYEKTGLLVSFMFLAFLGLSYKNYKTEQFVLAALSANVNNGQNEIIPKLVQVIERSIKSAPVVKKSEPVKREPERVEPAKQTAEAAPAPGGFEISVQNPLVGGNFWMDGKLCAGIEQVVGHTSVVDFGAGLGQYGRCFCRSYEDLLNTDEAKYEDFKNHLISRMKDAAIYEKPQVIASWEGYDGGTNIEQITKKWVKHINLAKSFDLKKKFDWVISLEVGEHIPHEFEDVFMDNLVKHANKGIILSWAVLGQGGHNHINNQPNDYVISKMKERGLKHDAANEKFLRSSLVQTYFANTLMVFVK